MKSNLARHPWKAAWAHISINEHLEYEKRVEVRLTQRNKRLAHGPAPGAQEPVRQRPAPPPATSAVDLGQIQTFMAELPATLTTLVEQVVQRQLSTLVHALPAASLLGVGLPAPLPGLPLPPGPRRHLSWHRASAAASVPVNRVPPPPSLPPLPPPSMPPPSLPLPPPRHLEGPHGSGSRAALEPPQE